MPGLHGRGDGRLIEQTNPGRVDEDGAGDISASAFRSIIAWVSRRPSAACRKTKPAPRKPVGQADRCRADRARRIGAVRG